MTLIEGGHLLTAEGFRAGSAACGIKDTAGALDVALLVSDSPCTVAGVFTQNRFAAAPVQWCRRLVPGQAARGVAINAGNANACTGEQGCRDARETAATLAGLLGCSAESICVASTGIIGQPLPMERLREGVRRAHESLANTAESALAAARAIMTTDRHPKMAAAEVNVSGRKCRIGAMAKGAGMIAPHMATLLCFITTDAELAAEDAQRALRLSTERTLNRITIDGDTSTNDTALLLASGASRVRVSSTGELAAFTAALSEVLAELCSRIVADGEGATRTMQVSVSGAATEQDAELAARAVAESQLVKCALYGADPNWGRIVCALGYSGAELRVAGTRVTIGDVCVFDGGMLTQRDAAAHMAADRVRVVVELGVGRAESRVLTCDLTEEYVRFNAEYHT